jgi:hypothetical protein
MILIFLIFALFSSDGGINAYWIVCALACYLFQNLTAAPVNRRADEPY